MMSDRPVRTDPVGQAIIAALGLFIAAGAIALYFLTAYDSPQERYEKCLRSIPWTVDAQEMVYMEQECRAGIEVP